MLQFRGSGPSFGLPLELHGFIVLLARHRRCRLDLSSFRFAKVVRSRFEGCRLDETDLYGAAFEETCLSGCTLVRASLAETTFLDCDLRGCDLSGIGNPERLRGVRMPWSDVVESAGALAAGLGIEVVD